MPQVLLKPGTYKLEEKHSKFYGYCAPIKTQAQVQGVLSEMYTAYKNASHYVYVYSLSASNVIRFHDDGEPHGTAGRPILTVFQNNNVIDFICVVTRYFGGTLLGSGGLTRAYAKTAKGAMDDAGLGKQVLSKLFRVVCTYGNLKMVKYNFNKWGIEIVDVVYTDCCEVIVRVQDEKAAAFLGTHYIPEEIPDGYV
jgi:uncharacterized YigZ family protein